jgi:hypothetical protein
MSGKDKDKEYATIQIRRSVKDQLVRYCDIHGLKIGRYVEKIFLADVSGSHA